MGRILGLDLGTNSIGWAIVDTEQNSIVECGVKIFPLQQEPKSKLINSLQRLFDFRFKITEFIRQSFMTSPFLFGLTSITVLTLILTILNKQNWQFWLNISLTALLTTLTIFHQDKNKK